MTVELRRIWPPDVYKLGDPSWDVPACAHVVDVVRTSPGRSIHVAGTLAYDADLQHQAPGDMTGQIRVTMENIRRSLAAVGATPADVVRVKTYVTDLDAFKNDGLSEFMRFWAGEPPASTTVQIVALGHPEAVIEMEVYAELD